MKSCGFLAVIVSTVVVAAVSVALADTPQMINYQGRLTDDTGAPIDGVLSMTFTIYDDSTGGVIKWAETHPTVTVTEGLFNVTLGAGNPAVPIGDTVFDQANRWLGITIGSDAELEPRTRLVSVGFAHRVSTVDGASGGGIHGNTMVNGDIHASGNISCGSSIVIDGTNDMITASSGTLDFDDETLVTEGGVDVKSGSTSFIVNSDGVSLSHAYPPSEVYALRVQRGHDIASPDIRFGILGDVWNVSDGTIYGVQGAANCFIDGSGGMVLGVYGRGTSDGSRYGVHGYASSHTSPPVELGTSYGVFGHGKSGLKAYGVFGLAQDATTGYGVYGKAEGCATNWAGYFEGDCRVTGYFDNSKSSFIIDHPTDPSGRFLRHATVASPDMMNVYNGNVMTDANGRATVELPGYFDALNKDFRYQLTVIGTFAQAIVEQEISGNQFVIATSQPNVKVSWQVTGIRKDAYAEANRTSVETDKLGDEAGKCLHPELFGLGEEMRIGYDSQQEQEAEMQERSSNDSR